VQSETLGLLHPAGEAMIRAELYGGPRDGEVIGLAAPGPGELRFQAFAWPGDPAEAIVTDVGVYARDPALHFAGAMVRYNWKGWIER
jgi:hypothetical protein